MCAPRLFYAGSVTTGPYRALSFRTAEVKTADATALFAKGHVRRVGDLSECVFPGGQIVLCVREPG
jgi:hypothetical protein